MAYHRAKAGLPRVRPRRARHTFATKALQAGVRREVLKKQLRHASDKSLDVYVWRFVEGRPVVGRFRALSELPAETELSQALSKDLKRRGFRFVGPTVCYAFMQAVGLVNDHTVDCFRFAELTRGS